MQRSAEVEAQLSALHDSTFPRETRELVKAASTEQLTFQPEPGEWSIVEMLRHQGDTEEMRRMRFDRMLAEDTPFLERIEPTPGDRDSEEADVLLARLERFRAELVAMLSTLSDEQWHRGAMQGPDPQVNRTAPEPTSVLKEAWKIDLHAGRHLEQMRKNLRIYRAQHGG